MIQIEKTKIGLLTMKYDNKYIHSKYDPIKEAKMFIEANSDMLSSKVIAVYGLGLGYHIDVIAEEVSSDSMVYVFEYNMDLIKCCKELNKKVFEYRDVKIIGSDEKSFYKLLSESIGEAGDILIHRPSLETIKDTNEALYNLIDNYSLMKQSEENNQELKILSKENYEFNIKQNYNLINEFIDLYKDSSKPYIITSAGPSLDDELDLLSENREKFNVISVGSSLSGLMKKGIRPDAIVLLDGREIVKNQLIGYENEDIPLCFSAKASRWAVNNYKGPKYIFNVSENDKFKISDEETVAIPAIDIAVKCGAKKIIFLGQDLAYIDNRSHTKTFETTYGIKDDDANKNKVRTIKGVDGKKVKTAQGYIRFKFKIERLIRMNSHVKFINCSKGAFIEGAEHMEFKELLDKL